MTIVEQYRECFKDVPIGTKFTRKEIIDMLHSRYGTNEASILPSDHSYNMTNKGIRGSNRGNNFFLNVGDGEYEYVGEHFTGMPISDVIQLYKQDFERVNREERYKWLAIGWYKAHWDIDAPDFARMFSVAFSKHVNLLMSRMYYPYGMACEFAEEHPEEARALFRQLYDESVPLAQRYKLFREGFNANIEELLKKEEGRTKHLNHYQDLHAVSVYLAFEYPEKYCIYKASVYENFRNLVGFAEDRGKAKSEVWRLENCNRLSDEIMKAIDQDPEVVSMSRNRLGDGCYMDENNRLLSMDIMYFGNWIEKDRKANAAAKTEIVSDEDPEAVQEVEQMTDIDKNTILYGPPGTGKTYSMVLYAVAAIEKKPLAFVKNENYDDVLNRFNQYKEQGRIVSTTFHQSYGYEEFVEGIKPVMESDGEEAGDIRYQIASGVFKQFCDRAARPAPSKGMDYGLNQAPSVWKVSLGGTYENPTRTECLENGHIRIGWDAYGPEIGDDTVYSEGGKNVLNALIYGMKNGDVVLSCFSNTTIDAVGVVTGDYEWHDEYDHYKRLRKVNWLVRNIREDITEINNGISDKIQQTKTSKSLGRNIMIFRPNLPADSDRQAFCYADTTTGNLHCVTNTHSC